MSITIGLDGTETSEFSAIAEILQIKEQLIGDYTVQAVDGRQLQKALGSNRDFSSWIKSKILDCDLTQSIDYTSSLLPISGEQSRGVKYLTEYTLTLDAAKMIAMSCRGETGKLVRRYFLQMEKVAQSSIRSDALTHKSDAQSVIDEYVYRVNACGQLLKILGYSEGFLRKEALEIGVATEAETGVKVIPLTLLNDPQAKNPELLDPALGTHAAMVAIGSQGLNAGLIAKRFDLLTSKDVNDLLVRLGYQVYHYSGTYTPTDKASRICNTEVRQSGRFKGRAVVKSWNIDTNRAFRDDLDEHLQALSDLRVKAKASK